MFQTDTYEEIRNKDPICSENTLLIIITRQNGIKIMLLKRINRKKKAMGQ